MIRIRSCEGFEEMEACVQLQIETWGYDEPDVIPRKTFMLAGKIGGQVIGAFEGKEPVDGSERDREAMVGFALSLPGIKSGGNAEEPGGRAPQAYLHSHMLAVKEGYRNRGLGAQLKWEQRRESLERGIRHMEWTFDPLEIKNAFLNIHRLGAVVRGYRPDFYGVSSSRLQGGLPTDRLLAEWELDSPRVSAALDGRPAVAEIEERIVVPAAISQWKAEGNRERALAVQLENRRKFQQAFGQGLVVTGFSLDPEGNGVFELSRLTGSDEVIEGTREPMRQKI
jgi:predicted GNAT superfamily acetyltransferase